MATTDEVSATSAYNTVYTTEELALYDLMTQETPSDELLAEYKEMFTNMSTNNPFAGVLNNPMQCEVDQANADINEIIELFQAVENVPEWIPAALEEASANLNSYLEHTDRLIGNFPSISSIVQNQIAQALSTNTYTSTTTNSGTGGSGTVSSTGNPCGAFGDIMGSILQAGQDIMNEILVALQNVKDNVNEVTALIEDSVNKLMAAIAKAMTKIQEETDKIAEAMLNMNKMNLASMLKYQMQDPCLNSILNSTLTNSATNALKG